MAVDQADLELYQGDDYAGTVTVLDEFNAPADITGFTAAAQIRRGVADSDPIVVAELDTIVDSPLILLSLSKTITETLSGRYIWDLQLTNPTGGVSTILRGRVVVTSEVTREVA